MFLLVNKCFLSFVGIGFLGDIWVFDMFVYYGFFFVEGCKYDERIFVFCKLFLIGDWMMIVFIFIDYI